MGSEVVDLTLEVSESVIVVVNPKSVSSGPFGEFCGGFCVVFVDGSAGYQMGKLVNAEGELHALNGPAGVLVNLVIALLFGGPLPDHVCGMISSEIGC